jgi:hypothetical protein
VFFQVWSVLTIGLVLFKVVSFIGVGCSDTAPPQLVSKERRLEGCSGRHHDVQRHLESLDFGVINWQRAAGARAISRVFPVLLGLPRFATSRTVITSLLPSTFTSMLSIEGFLLLGRDAPNAVPFRLLSRGSCGYDLMAVFTSLTSLSISFRWKAGRLVVTTLG